jgi:hypothetical protein
MREGWDEGDQAAGGVRLDKGRAAAPADLVAG